MKKKEIKLEEDTEIVSEELISNEVAVEKAPKKKPEVVPEAQLVFDEALGNEWLAKSYVRVRNAYRSIRFDPSTMATEHVVFLLELAAHAIAKEYKPIHFLPDLERGVLFVPEFLADADVLKGLERGEQVGKYVAFRLP